MSNVYDMADTWNDAGTTFTAIKMNVTDTASNAASLLMDLQIGGVSKESTDKSGNKTLAGSLVVANGSAAAASIRFASGSAGSGFYSTANGTVSWSTGGDTQIQLGGIVGAGVRSLRLKSTNVLGWSSGDPDAAAEDLSLYRDAANTLAQRNGTNAQTHRIYNTYTDAANYERLSLGWAANVLTIGTEAAGTGTQRDIKLSGANRATLVADATDLASVITLANALKASQISHGLMAAA